MLRNILDQCFEFDRTLIHHVLNMSLTCLFLDFSYCDRYLYSDESVYSKKNKKYRIHCKMYEVHSPQKAQVFLSEIMERKYTS